MSRAATIRFLRTTRAALDAERDAGHLILAEPYVVIDEVPMRLAIGEGPGDYTDVGGAGGSGGVSMAVQSFPTPALSWTITHNLGRTVDVVAYTVGSVKMLADVVLLSNNIAVANFSTPTAGYARVI